LRSWPEVYELSKKLHRVVSSLLRDGKYGIATLEWSLMAIEKGKNPVPLVITTEETAAPMTVAGPHAIAFAIGPFRTIPSPSPKPPTAK
jgi:hypothetical protein